MDAKPVATARDVDYLRRLFRMNPQIEACEILAVRRAWKSDQQEPPPGDIASHSHSQFDQRGILANQIDALRDRFWTLNHDDLQRELSQLKTDKFPELNLEVAILQTVSTRMIAFERLKTHPHCFPEFLDLFCRLVIAAPKLALQLRQELEIAAQNGLSSPQCRSVQEYHRLVEAIENEFPELAALQAPLLSRIRLTRHSQEQYSIGAVNRALHVGERLILWTACLLVLGTYMATIYWLWRWTHE